MRLLLISALAAALIGCSSTGQQALHFDDATLRLYQTREVRSPQMDSKHGRAIAAKKENAGNTHVKNAKPNLAVSSVPPDDITTAIAAKTETLQASQVGDPSNSVIRKAKATITAKLGNPASVTFEEMNGPTTKYALGNPVDAICGFVRENNGVDRPFLYLVQKDEAYIGGYTIATGAYRNICPITR
jgi:hypothetical protein